MEEVKAEETQEQSNQADKPMNAQQLKEIGVADDLCNGVDMLQHLGLTFEIVKLLAPLGNPAVKQVLEFLSNLHKGTLDECINHKDAEKVPQFKKFFSKAPQQEEVTKEQIEVYVEKVVDEKVDKLLNE